MNVKAKYLRMIQRMKRRGRKDWTVYILRCGDGSLYTGIAKDVQARVKQHSEGRGATYTRTRLPVKLLYQQESLTHSKALIREAQIKAMPRSKKEEIIFKWKLYQTIHSSLRRVSTRVAGAITHASYLTTQSSNPERILWKKTKSNLSSFSCQQLAYFS